MADRESRPGSARVTTPDPDTLQDMTPPTAEAVPEVTDSRYNVVREAATPKERKSLKWLLYEGRKGSTGAVRRTAEEHIDVIVPSEDNPDAVEAFLDAASPSGALLPAQRQELADAGISADTLQIAGERDYHFISGQATPVLPEHAAYLLKHRGYAFREVDPQ